MFRGPRYMIERFLISIVLGKPNYKYLKKSALFLYEDIKVLLYTGYTVEEILNKQK